MSTGWLILWSGLLITYIVALIAAMVSRSRAFHQQMRSWERQEAERRRLYEQSEQEWRKAMEEK